MSLRNELRAACHALRMQGLGHLDEPAQIRLTQEIKALPSPEKIAALSASALQNLRAKVGRLLFALNQAGQDRTLPRAVQHRMDKNLPPRRPPLLASWYQRWSREG